MRICLETNYWAGPDLTMDEAFKRLTWADEVGELETMQAEINTLKSILKSILKAIMTPEQLVQVLRANGRPRACLVMEPAEA